ncbi:hypothetical protein ACFV4P_24085 [Kitasatospora sp. NPDC059795]|uniref:hypothetical protein n=1 Tax=Kitasatospora sp. NPDC059795 TaxID=3346949 RepID=UPI003660AEB7
MASWMILVMVPLALWLLAAPPGRVRTRIAAVLATAALFTWAAMEGWLPVGITATAALAGWCVLAAAPAVGLKLAWPVHKGKGGGRRAFVAAWMTAFSLLAGAATCLFGVLLLGNGPSARVPDASELPAMPAGLHISADHDNGCGGNSSFYCSRTLTVVGASDQDATQLVERLRAQLASSDWKVVRRDGGSWLACRSIGVLLDTDELCAELSVTDGAVTVDLSTSDSW